MYHTLSVVPCVCVCVCVLCDVQVCVCGVCVRGYIPGVNGVDFVVPVRGDSLLI